MKEFLVHVVILLWCAVPYCSHVMVYMYTTCSVFVQRIIYLFGLSELSSKSSLQAVAVPVSIPDSQHILLGALTQTDFCVFFTTCTNFGMTML